MHQHPGVSIVNKMLSLKLMLLLSEILWCTSIQGRILCTKCWRKAVILSNRSIWLQNIRAFGAVLTPHLPHFPPFNTCSITWTAAAAQCIYSQHTSKTFLTEMEHFYCASSLKMQWWTVSSIPMYQLTQHQWWVEYRNDANKSWKSTTVDQDPGIMHTSTKRFSANNKYSTAICFCYSIIIWRFPSPLNPQNPLIQLKSRVPRVTYGQ